MPAPSRRSSRSKVEAYRARLRVQGLRPVQVWVPDTRSPAFVAEASSQARAVAASGHAEDDQAFVEAIAEPWSA